MNSRIFFYVNPSKSGVESALGAAVEIAREAGFEYLSFSDPEAMYASAEEAPPCLIVAVGGDGTILHIAAYALNNGRHYEIPILGVNLGKVGFFTETVTEDFKASLTAFKNGDYTVECRSTLKCRLSDGRERIALNDFLVFKKDFFSIAHIDTTIDGAALGTIPADGIVISSSAGSTGYSVSAGGPVVSPKLDVILVTPVCPHSLTARPVVTAFDSVVRLKTQSDCELSADGIRLTALPAGSELSISGSRRQIRFVRVSERNIFRLIHDRLA